MTPALNNPALNDPASPTIVFVPGLRDHVEELWQTLLANKIDRSRTVPPLEEDKLSLDARIAALDAVVSEIEGPIVLVAHSAGVQITVQWAQRHDRPILGALLAAPTDVETQLPAGYPTLEDLESNGWTPIPRRKLPFPSIVAASSNDGLVSRRRAAGMAEVWGSKLVDVGEAGHLNPASGYGDWPLAEDLILELAQVREGANS